MPLLSAYNRIFLSYISENIMDRKLDCKVMSTNLKRWCSVVALCSATIMASGVVHAEDIPDPFAAVRAQQNAGPNNAPAIATVDAANSPTNAPIIIPEAPTFNAESWVLMDYATGQVLFEHDQHKRIWPASLTKMMTSYVIGMEIKAGRLDPESYVTIPKSAWAALDKYADSSKMFIEVGKKVKVE